MLWYLSHQADRRAAALADRHYSRKTIGSRFFVPPGRQMVLLTERADALWVTSWPRAEYAFYPDAFICTLFRNESVALSSELIRQAVAATLWKYGPAPEHGMLTFIDAGKVKPKRDPGYCFLKAGFVEAGRTKKSGLVILQLPIEAMPEAEPPAGAQLRLFDEGVA